MRPLYHAREVGPSLLGPAALAMRDVGERQQTINHRGQKGMPAFDRRIMIIPTPGSARGTLRSLQATARPSRLQIRKNGYAEANLGLCVAISAPMGQQKLHGRSLLSWPPRRK
jgi:hypothetical protein